MKSYKYTFYSSREDVIEGYLMNSPKVVAEMLYDTIERYEKELKKGQENYDKLWDMYSELKKELGNRTCKSCKYSEVEDNVWKSMRCKCDKPSIMPYEDGAIYLNIYEDFCCNQYEPKENK